MTFAPLLSRAAFMKTAAGQKPGASYGGYVNYVKNTRARRASARQQPAAMPGLQTSLYSPAMVSQAKTGVDQQLAAQLAQMKTQSDLQTTQTNNQAERAQGFALALAQATQPNPQTLKDQYLEAADRLNSFGSGLTGAVAADVSSAADKTKADLANVGITDKAGSYDPASLQNTAQLTGVVMPGQGLVGQAQNAYDLANYDRQASTGRIGDIAQQYLAKTTDLQNQLTAQESTLEATRPQLYQSALSSMSDAQRQQRALDVQVGTLQLQQAKTAQDQAVAMTNLTGTVHVVQGVGRNAHVVDTGKPAAGSTAVTHQATITGQNQRAADDRRVRQEIADSQNKTKLTVAQTAAAAKKAAAALTKSGKGTAATPAQRSSILKNVYAAGNQYMNTRVAHIKSLMQAWLAPQGQNESDDAYGKRRTRALQIFQGRMQEYHDSMISDVTNQITPYLTLVGYGPDQINGMATSIVAPYSQKSP